MLSVEQLYVNYGEKEILHDVDLQVAQEEIVVLRLRLEFSNFFIQSS